MLWTIALILIVLWLLGLVTSTTAGGLIHPSAELRVLLGHGSTAQLAAGPNFTI